MCGVFANSIKGSADVEALTSVGAAQNADFGSLAGARYRPPG